MCRVCVGIYYTSETPLISSMGTCGCIWTETVPKVELTLYVVWGGAWGGGLGTMPGVEV